MRDRKRLIQKKRQSRKKQIRLTKNFFPTLIVTLLAWLGFAYIIFFVNPIVHGAVQLFFLNLTVALTLTLSIAFANTRRGLISAFSIVFFLVLRYLGIGNAINLFLITGLAVTLELYLGNKL